MNGPEEALELLTAASRDLNALRAMMEPEMVAEEIFGFHVQQAAEKALKAWITALGSEYPRTHDIGILLRILETLGCEVNDLAHLLRWNLFAVQFRYSTYESAGEALDRADAHARIAELLRRVGTAITSDQR